MGSLYLLKTKRGNGGEKNRPGTFAERATPGRENLLYRPCNPAMAAAVYRKKSPFTSIFIRLDIQVD
jgi:hypothetical protein